VAELSGRAGSCCDAAVQATCCEPAAKDACCAPGDDACGCGAGAAPVGGGVPGAVSQPEISTADPRTDEIRGLLERHLSHAQSHVPARDRHALDADALVDAGVEFYALRVEGELLAVGALKRLDDAHAEVKSMHTVERARRRGLGQAMLDHLLAVARDRGFRRVSLETGSMAAFAPARALYARTGFSVCGPFGDYVESENKTFMTLAL